MLRHDYLLLLKFVKPKIFYRVLELLLKCDPMKLTWKIAIVAGVFCLTSCAQILGDLLFPDSCMRCKVYIHYNINEWSSEECGGGQSQLEQECKAIAYDKGF